MIEAAEETLGLDSKVMPPTLAPPGDGLTRNNLDIQFLNAIDTDEELNKTLSLT